MSAKLSRKSTTANVPKTAQGTSPTDKEMTAEERCGRCVMAVFAKLVPWGNSKQKGWEFGQLSRSQIEEEMPNDECVGPGIKYATGEKGWLSEKLVDGQIFYVPNENALEFFIE